MSGKTSRPRNTDHNTLRNSQSEPGLSQVNELDSLRPTCKREGNLCAVHGYSSQKGVSVRNNKVGRPKQRDAHALSRWRSLPTAATAETVNCNQMRLTPAVEPKPLDESQMPVTSNQIAFSTMPKKTSVSAAEKSEKRPSTRIFRSGSLLTRRSDKKENGVPQKGRRTSSLSISDAEKQSTLIDQNLRLVEERKLALDECNRVMVELEEARTKSEEAKTEIEHLKSLLSSYTKDLTDPSRTDNKTSELLSGVSEGKGLNLTEDEKLSTAIIFPSKIEQHESTIEANVYAVGHHSSPCKECERLKQTRIKAVVEAVALRKHVQQLSEALSQGDVGKENLMNEIEKKLTAALTEKEVALEELATVIEQRDGLVSERDKAQEEWGKAASKWEKTLDQLDSLLKDLNQVKGERDDLTTQIDIVKEQLRLETETKEKLMEQLTEEYSDLHEQLHVTRKERIETISEHDTLLKEKYLKEQELRKTNTELTKAQQRCIEFESKLATLAEKSDNYKKERDHAKEQWRHSVKERKKMQRETAVVKQARDEAIQKCFSTAEQLDKLKEEYNRMLNRLARTGISQYSSELSIPCSLKECKLCEEESFEINEEDVQPFEGEEINVTLEKEEPLESIKCSRVTSQNRTFVAIMDMDKSLKSTKNMRKYDELVSINDIPVTHADMGLIRSLLDGATTTINLLIRRPLKYLPMNFDVELKPPKKSKQGLGFECGLYIKYVVHAGIADEQLQVGDYILKINGKHLDKVIGSAVEKICKKSGDKLKMHVTRNPQTQTEAKSPNDVVLRTRRSDISLEGKNRLSLISNDSSISKHSGNSSLGSMSLTDSCFADSSSDQSGSVYHSNLLIADRLHISRAVYRPSSNNNIDLITSSVTTLDEEPSQDSLGSEEVTVVDCGTLKPSATDRKYFSSSELVYGMRGDRAWSSGCLNRAHSTITAIRADDDGLGTRTLQRPATCETLIPGKERPRVMRLEKESYCELGVEVTGGNLVGIYVKEMTADSVCKVAGLRVGDRLFKLNSYDLSRATLDYGTRIVKMLSKCTYLRMEAQHVDGYEEYLREAPWDSIYVRTKHAYTAVAPDELSFTVGETLHVINTRANYDPARHSWKWVAQRARKDGKNVEEGLIPSLGSLPEQAETWLRETRAESSDQLSEEPTGTLSRNTTERRSLLQRYRSSSRKKRGVSRDYSSSEDARKETETYPRGSVDLFQRSVSNTHSDVGWTSETRGTKGCSSSDERMRVWCGQLCEHMKRNVTGQ